MPRKSTHHGRTVYLLPDDFPQRLVRFKEESGLTWAEIARRIGTTALNLRRWRNGVRPHWRHLKALLELAEDLGLAHLFTDWKLPEAARVEESCPSNSGGNSERVGGKAAPSRSRNPGRRAARE